jgi:hypothetical protein
MNRISLCLFMAIKFVYFVLCHLGWGRVWTWVYYPPMTYTILSGRWVGNTGCPAKSSTQGGHPILHVLMCPDNTAEFCRCVCVMLHLDVSMLVVCYCTGTSLHSVLAVGVFVRPKLTPVTSTNPPWRSTETFASEAESSFLIGDLIRD